MAGDAARHGQHVLAPRRIADPVDLGRRPAPGQKEPGQSGDGDQEQKSAKLLHVTTDPLFAKSLSFAKSASGGVADLGAFSSAHHRPACKVAKHYPKRIIFATNNLSLVDD
jgi:hypothetical protein